MTHENFWRQLLRWLVDGVPGRGRGAHVDRACRSGRAGHPHRRCRGRVLRRAQRRARGRERRRARGDEDRRADAVDRRAERPVPRRRSRRTRRRPLRRAGRSVAGREAARHRRTHVRAAPGDAEYFDATMHAARLQRIAEETGGRFYTAETISGTAGGSEVHRPGRDDGRRARPVAHADRAAAARRADVRASGAIAGRWGWRDR